MNIPIPFNDLSRTPTELATEISEAASRISVSGNYVLGQEVKSFETELSTYLNLDWIIGVGNGTDALTLALIALGVGPGDVVVTQANAGGYTTLSAKSIGAEPVFVDISERTLQVTKSNLVEVLESCERVGIKPKVIVVTHLFGQLNQEISEIVELAHSKDIYLIEDCAQALGGSLNGVKAGCFGDLATFSFYPTKNLGAIGDGGAIGGSSKLQSKVESLRQYGWGEKYQVENLGGKNSRLDEIQAGVLRLKLNHLDSWNARRRQIFESFLSAANEKVKFFSESNQSYIAHLIPIAVEGMTQQQVTKFFADRGIATGIHYPIPDHLQKLDFKYQNLIDLPITEEFANKHITIPIFPELTTNEIERISKALSEIGN